MSTNVTLYVESGSATSEQTKAAMDSAGIIYEVVAVTASDYPLQAVGTSYPTAPVTVVDGAAWDGHRPDLIARLAADQALEMYQVPVDPMDELYCDSQSGCQAELGPSGVEGGAVSEHGPDDIHSPSGEGDDGLFVGLALFPFAVVVGGGDGTVVEATKAARKQAFINRRS